MKIPIDKKFCENAEALKTLIEQVYYVDQHIVKCVPKGDSLILKFEDNYNANFMDIEKEIQKNAKLILDSFDRVKLKIIYENNGHFINKCDPMENLLKTRQVVETYPGVFALQGEFLNTVIELDIEFRSFALNIGAVEQKYQPTLPVKSLIENGYISSFPQHPLFVSNVLRSSKTLKELAKAAKAKDNTKWHNYLEKNLDVHSQVLSPTVCYHCFETLRDQYLPGSGKIFTAIAPCHRHESKNINGLARLQTFTMREIIYFGTAEFVESCRQDILSHCESFLKSLDMKFRVITATDPFFTTGAEAKRIFQNALELKYELQTYIPHSGSWLSVASFNNHQQSLVTPYNIGFDSDAGLHSGCVGYGYERLAYAIYSQFGCDQSSWPQSFIN